MISPTASSSSSSNSHFSSLTLDDENNATPLNLRTDLIESSSTTSSSPDLNNSETTTKLINPENRRNRTSFTSHQLNILETYFLNNTYPSAIERDFLVKQTNLDEDKIIVIF